MYLNLMILFTTVLASLGHDLKQVIVLSRHNIRTPFSYRVPIELITPNIWPTWNLEPGSLTPKGHCLERNMGKYFSDWMIEEKLFDNNCPKDQVFVYANNLPRTKETAKSFTEGAFGDCVDVYFKNTTEYDPIFKLVFTNASNDFQEAVSNEIRRKFNRHVNKLRDGFLELNRIADFGKSSYCKTEKVCDFNEAQSTVVVENGWPTFDGALDIGWSLVDSFLMEYYDGLPSEDVGWGQIQTDKQWESLMAVLRAHIDLRFKTKIWARHAATPLLKYISDIFQNGEKKFYLLVSHDVVLRALMTSLDFKHYVLRDQLENMPIGGKLVFQKWYEKENNEHLLRVDYVYQSFKDIRDGAEVSLQNPPIWQILEIKQCAVDDNGYCPWKDFINILNTV